jgi:L-lactate permease
MSGEPFTHEYCARIDILYDKNGDGFAESVLYNRFMIPITYRFEKGNNSNDAIVSASIAGSGSQLDTKQIIGIAIGAVVGSLITLLLVFLLCRFKRYRSDRREDDQIKVERPNGLLI